MTAFTRRALALAMAVLPAAAAASGYDDPSIVVTRSGPVHGVVNAQVREFLGIPYAAPPVGVRRWRPPHAPSSWSTVRDATQPGPACAQRPSPFGPASDSEDCLYLNVYTPSASTDARLPVIVWIHGGGFSWGQGADYDGSALVQAGNVIVVTLNYRLGALGFLAHPALSRESADYTSGNYGLMDQQYALRWVRRNIAAFGGDPNKVTIAGQSAGGLSVLSQLASPRAAGLFQRAIVQSGTYRPAWPTAAEALSRGKRFAQTAGCTFADEARCLRALPVQQLIGAQDDPATLPAQVEWGPHVGDNLLPEQPSKAFRTGVFNRVPVLIGTTRDEGRLFVGLSFDQEGTPITSDSYAQEVTTALGPLAAPLALTAYPLDSYSSPDLAFGTLFGDSGISCTGHILEGLLSEQVETYVYEFNDENAGTVFLPVYSFPYGATHTSDLPFLFPDVEGHQYNSGPAVLSDAELQLATIMRSLWTQFARTGAPSTAGLPRWPRYNHIAGNFLSLSAPTPAMSNGFVAEHKCAFWTPQIELNALLPQWITGGLE